MSSAQLGGGRSTGLLPWLLPGVDRESSLVSRAFSSLFALGCHSSLDPLSEDVLPSADRADLLTFCPPSPPLSRIALCFSTANAAETTCVGSSDNILAHFANTSSSSSPDVSISHTWRVFRVDGDGEGTSDDGGATLTETGVVENVSERLGQAGISCYYTA